MKIRLIRGILVVITSGFVTMSVRAQDNPAVNSNPFNHQTKINTWTPPSGHQTYDDYGPIDEILRGPRYLVTHFHLGEGLTIPLTHREVNEPAIMLRPAQADPFRREPFYPHLAALIGKGILPKSLHKRLMAFQQRRDEAARVLWAKVSQMESISENEANIAWKNFENEQAPEWAKLDRERKSLLSRFQSGGFMKPGVNLRDALSLLEFSDVRPEDVPLVTLAVIRHFVTSLSAEQRDLLGEIVQELSSLDSPSAAPPSQNVAGLGRQRIMSKSLTDQQSSAFTAYLKTRSELKQELVETLSVLVPIEDRNQQLRLSAVRLHSSDRKTFEDALRTIFDSDAFIGNWKKLESAATRLRTQQAPKFEQMNTEWLALMNSLEEIPIQIPSPHAVENKASIRAKTIGLMSPTSVRLLSGVYPTS